MGCSCCTARISLYIRAHKCTTACILSTADSKLIVFDILWHDIHTRLSSSAKQFLAMQNNSCCVGPTVGTPTSFEYSLDPKMVNNRRTPRPGRDGGRGSGRGPTILNTK